MEYKVPKGYHLVKDWDTLTPQEKFNRGDLTGGGTWTFGHPACYEKSAVRDDLPIKKRIYYGYCEIWRALKIQNTAAQQYTFSRKILEEMTKSAKW